MRKFDGIRFVLTLSITAIFFAGLLMHEVPYLVHG